MSKRIYNTLRGSGEPTKAMAIQSSAIRRRMDKLKKTGRFTSYEIICMEAAAYAKMRRELGILVTKETSDSDTNNHDKSRIRTMLWP